MNEDLPKKLDNIDLPYSKQVPIYNIPKEGGGTGICFVPLNRDLKEHLHVYKNFETGKCTEEDEKEYLNLHTPYRVGYVMTFCETIEEFMKKEFKKIEKIANERLTKMNKTT